MGQIKPSGFLLINGQEVGTTLMCAHCNQHFLSIKGSGAHRGYCTHCKAVLCGAQQCFDRCIPFEAKLDYLDGGNGLASKRWDLDLAYLIAKYKNVKI